MEKRYFALRTSQGGKELAVFTGRQPRQAALKAASRGYTSIFLRERGTKKLHNFKGMRKKVRAPIERPDWMAAVVWKPNVKKLGVIHLAKPKKKVVKKKAKRKVKKKAKKRTTKRRVTKKKATKKKATKRKVTKKKTAKRRTTRRRR